MNKEKYVFAQLLSFLEAQKCRAVDIFKLNGKVYAFDSTAIDMCLSAF